MQSTARPMSLKELINTSPLACFGILLMGGVYAVLYAMSPIYATERGLSVSQTSYFIMAIFTGAMVFQFPIGWLSDRMDRRLLIIAATAVGATVAGASMYMSDNYVVLLVSAVLLGGVANPLYSLLVAYANDYLEQDQMAAASGGLMFINGFGAMAGPVLVGYAMTQLGLEWYFITLFLLLSAICLYGIYRISQRPHEIVDESAPYLPISARSSGLATEFALLAAEDEQLEAEEDAEEVFELRLDDIDPASQD